GERKREVTRFEDDSRETAARMDSTDPLAPFADEFARPGEDLVYLDGNSLGMLPARTAAVMGRVIEKEWGERLIRGWNEKWLGLSRRLGAKIAKIIGAGEDEVIIADSTSVSLFKLAAAALRRMPGRKKVISDTLNFPSDIYILQSAIGLVSSGHRLELAPPPAGKLNDAAWIAGSIDGDTALVSLSHVAFKSSFMYDLQAVSAAAREAGATTLWDLSHSAGVVPADIGRSGADMAVGCTYKFLNGGPGSPAFIYVRKDLQEDLDQPLKGWFGCERPFDFDLDFHPARGISAFQTGTPPVIAMSALEPALDIVLEAGVDRIREKSVRLTAYMIYLFDEWLGPCGFTLGTPREPGCRGSHVSIRHPEAFRICRALTTPRREGEVTVIPDFREPDNIRLGAAPLYNSFVDIWTAMARIRDITGARIYEEYDGERNGVT
ncbi:MAG TPA: kynureninase, partial [Candidatus Krumholzibacterium sp.]|nr:kynureninase [Candidatus Krumholzibacterium sp.]